MAWLPLRTIHRCSKALLVATRFLSGAGSHPRARAAGLLAAAAGHPSDILLAGETSLEVRQLLAAPSLALAQHLARAARPSSISRSSGPASGGDGPAAGALTSTPEEGPSDREASPGWVADLPSVVAAVAQVLSRPRNPKP